MQTSLYEQEGASTISPDSIPSSLELVSLPSGISSASPIITDGASASAPDSSASSAVIATRKTETQLPASYLDYLSGLRSSWVDLPDLTITYRDLTYTVQVPVTQREIPNLYTVLRDSAIGLNIFRDKSKEMKEFRPISGASGIVRPGELTMVIAPPGHGKSVLLKALVS